MDKKNFDPDIDLYELLGISSSSSIQEIKKAYRKKALTCHPDKNPDNPNAAKLFHELASALEILIDESARAAYDRVLSGKKAAKLRHRELDAKRKKFKEDLEAREKVAQDAAASGRGYASANDEERLQAEIARLRSEGSRLIAEEMELMKEELRREAEMAKHPRKQSFVQFRLRLKWTTTETDTSNGGYTYDNLHKMFRQYGDIVALVISSKKQGSALIEFSTRDVAEKALRYEKGLATCPLRIESIGWSPQQQSTFNYHSETNRQKTSSQRPAFSCFPSAATEAPAQQSAAPSSCRDDSDFEQLVLRRLKEAQDQKKLECVDK